MAQDQESLERNLRLAILGQQNRLENLGAGDTSGIDNVIVGRIQALQDVLLAVKGNHTYLNMYRCKQNA